MWLRFRPWIPAISAIVLATTGAYGGGTGPVAPSPGEDFLAAADQVELREPVFGDALLAGGRVESNASVGGDMVAAGGDVTIRATVADDLYAAGGQVTVDALVGGNARIAGARVRVAPESRIGGGAVIAGGSVAADGRFGRYLNVAGGTVTLGGRIDGDVRVYANELRILSGTRIGGRLVYRTAEPVELPADVEIGGAVVREEPAGGRQADGAWRRAEDGMFRLMSWAWLAGLLAVGVLLTCLLAAFSRHTSRALTERPWFAMALGFVALACVPALIVALVLTLIGIPLALILLLLYLAMIIGAYVIGALYLGDRALAMAGGGNSPGAGRRLGALFLVLIALALVGGIPVLGDIARFMVLLLGLGGILLVARGGARGAAPPRRPAIETV